MENNSESIIIDNYVITKINNVERKDELQICKISWFENKIGKSTSSLIKISSGSKLNDNIIISELSNNKITYNEVINAWTCGKMNELTHKYKNITKQAIGAPDLPPLPFIVQPTHLYSYSSLYQILDTLTNDLSKKNINIIKFDPSKSKIKCNYSYRNESTLFVIQIFKVSDYYLIEITSRGMSRMCFSYAYDLVAIVLNDKNMIDTTFPISNQSFHQFKPYIYNKRKSIYDCPIPSFLEPYSQNTLDITIPMK